MKILHNSPNGAPIKDIGYKFATYFSEAKGDVFVPGRIVQVEDDFGEWLLKTYGFLKELSPDKAKAMIDKEKEQEAKKHKCDFEGCDFATNTPIALAGHKRKHQVNEEVENLDIPVVKGTKESEKEEENEKGDTAQAIENEANKAGLDVGSGLSEDRV